MDGCLIVIIISILFSILVTIANIIYFISLKKNIRKRTELIKDSHRVEEGHYYHIPQIISPRLSKSNTTRCETRCGSRGGSRGGSRIGSKLSSNLIGNYQSTTDLLTSINQQDENSYFRPGAPRFYQLIEQNEQNEQNEHMEKSDKVIRKRSNSFS